MPILSLKISAPLSRSLSALLWLIGIFILTISLNELLHRSQQPEILYWSVKKFLVCIGLFGIAFATFYASRKLRIPGLPTWLQSSKAPFIVFLFLTTCWFGINYSKPAVVGGDLEFQMVGFRQYLKGEVDQFNAQQVPIVDGDLAKDRVEHCIWYPPGPLYVLYPLVKLGLTPDIAARWMLYILAF